jgi:ASC-1-like (ASCH) protein
MSTLKLRNERTQAEASGGLVHLAVIGAEYARAILAGTKTIESRLTKTRRVPFGRVVRGERIYFLARKAGLIVTAVVERVESFSDLTPERVKLLREEYSPFIGGDDAYWKSKRESRYATLIQLSEPERARYGPDDVHGRERSYRSAWFVRPGQQCVYPACCRESCRVSA